MPFVFVDDDAVADVEFFGLGLQHRRGNREHIGAQRLAGLPGCFAANAGGARGPGAAAVGRIVGVAGDDAHLVHRHAERRGNALRHDRLGALALLGDAGVHDDCALGIELHRGAVHRGDAGATDAVKGGRRIGDLDEACKADAAIDSFFAQLLLLGTQTGVVHHRVEMGERLVVRQQLEFEAGGRLRRIGIVGDKIAAAQLKRIHADLGGGELDQAFGNRHGDRVADRAVLAHDILVLKHDARLRAIVRDTCRGRRSG